MKLREFNAQNSGSLRTGREPMVSINQKTGKIVFNTTAKEVLDLNENEKVAFFQDEDSPYKWFFSKSSNGFKLTKNSTKGLCFGCKKLASEIMTSLGEEKNYVHLPLIMAKKTIEGKDFYPINTLPAVKKFSADNARPKRF